VILGFSLAIIGGGVFFFCGISLGIGLGSAGGVKELIFSERFGN